MLFDVQAVLAEVLCEDPRRCDSRDCRDSEGAKSQESQESQSQAVAVQARAEAPSLAPPSAAGNAEDDPAYLADRFEELAAILEYDEGMPRAEAERAAHRIVHGGRS